MPLRMMEWVCPPQTSMMAHGRVVMRAMSSKSRRASSGSRNSSRYFMSDSVRCAGRFGVDVQLLFQHAHLLEEFEGFLCGRFVQLGDGEADMDDRIVDLPQSRVHRPDRPLW